MNAYRITYVSTDSTGYMENQTFVAHSAADALTMAEFETKKGSRYCTERRQMVPARRVCEIQCIEPVDGLERRAG